ncbi:MAG: leucine--tRNA ligase [Candidatus Paceibacterota bacterium]
MNPYSHKKIEKKWQKYWEKNKLDQAKDFSKRPKYYCLVEFPYPSGDGLHVGHTRSYTAMDIIARKRRMQGYNVLYPMGWDAFGLPTENYAIKKGVHPSVITKKNTDNFRRQLKSLAFSFDWSREINTTDPKYYKWTQWIFLQLFKKGLAYKHKMPINWCLSCKVGLANEEVVDGKCERCGGQTEKREKEQWMLAITKYADRLDKDLDPPAGGLDYLEKIKIQQRNWIGKSEGAEIEFKIQDSSFKFQVFTTRVDTIFGCTYVVVAPEHEIISKLKSQILNLSEVEKYINEAKRKSDLQRTELQKEKTGVELKGMKAINPFNNEEVSVFVADYVLGHYGTGAVMAVPAHDERDFEFAKKYGLPVRQSVARNSNFLRTDDEGNPTKSEISGSLSECFVEDGVLADSGQFSGLTSAEACGEMVKWLEEKKLGKKVVKFHLRDWVFSRQHYWGEPIPIVNCPKCGLVPVPEKDLPVKLPDVKKYEPTDTGESPLAAILKWVNVKCPKCKGPAKRETDTMPNWAGSSWYYLAYLMLENKKSNLKNQKYVWDKKKLKYWMPVDWYNGGMEHTTLHLLYSRFWNKFLFDIKAAPTSEPYKKRTSHGMILGPDGEKMSKSRGNVINPDDMVSAYGADAYRLYQMFMGPFDQAIPWDPKGIEGTSRFLGRVWKLLSAVSYQSSTKEQKLKAESGKLKTLLHKTIKKVSEDIESMRFNTAVSSLMILSNEMEKQEEILTTDYLILVTLLSPFAPHICEEIWSKLGNKKSIFLEKWPKFDSQKIREDSFELVMQVNGKVRDRFEAPTDISENDAMLLTLKRENVKKWIGDKQVKKVIFIQNKLINLIA